MAPDTAAGYVPGDLCAEHPDHFMPCSKCAGAECCPDAWQRELLSDVLDANGVVINAPPEQ